MHIKYRESTIGYLITDGLKNKKKFHTVNNNYMELNILYNMSFKQIINISEISIIFIW